MDAYIYTYIHPSNIDASTTTSTLHPQLIVQKRVSIRTATRNTCQQKHLSKSIFPASTRNQPKNHNSCCRNVPRMRWIDRVSTSFGFGNGLDRIIAPSDRWVVSFTFIFSHFHSRSVYNHLEQNKRMKIYCNKGKKCTINALRVSTVNFKLIETYDLSK